MPPIPADSLEPLPSAQGGQLFDGKKVKPKVQKPAAMEGIQKFGQKPQNMKQAEFHPTAHDGHPPTVGSGGSYRHQDAKKRGGKG
jgi:hypothetical protein